ncbi:MAG: Hsp20/alpha crystallin family protein [Planctomycetes bacterium]|nr:Hsp20/alpha crystallin family protein [Planctomycetota bacterium]
MGNHLLLQGERTAPKAEEGSWWCQERPFGKFARVLSLPCEVNADRFDTRLENGILHITLPKSASSRAELVWAESD